MKRQIVFLLFMCLGWSSIAWGTTATILRVDGKTVEIDVGASRGLTVGVMADVLTESGRVIHPVTGEDYGARKVKIGEIKIEKVQAEKATGRLTVVYAPVKVGDSVDGLVALPTEQERMQMEIGEARSEIKALARNLADEIKANKKAIEDLRQTLQRVGSSEKRLQSVMYAVQNMREKMVMVESRVSNLEQRQQVLVAKDTAEVDVLGKLNISDMGVLNRGEGEEIILRVGDRSYRLNFEANKLEETQMPVAMAPVAQAAVPPAETLPPLVDDSVGDLFADDTTEEDTTPWFLSWWFLGAVCAFVGLLAAGAILMLKKKKGQSGTQDARGDMAMGDTGFEEVDEDSMVEELDDLPELEPAEEEN